jgi:hypothetical protein
MQGARVLTKRRVVADVLAVTVAVAIFVTGVVLLVGDGDVTGPTSETTVVKERATPVPGARKETVTRPRAGQESGRSITVETQSRTGGAPRQTTVTTQAGERSLLERVLGDSGLVVLQIGVILLAAFVGGAVVQRIVIGDFSGIELGNLKLAALADASEKSTDKLKAEVVELRELLDHNIARADDTQQKAALLAQSLALAYQRMDLIDKKIDDGAGS